eukprot:COSAG06_NODE_12011_length_1435_cov_18.140719_1_plen_96_part_10
MAAAAAGARRMETVRRDAVVSRLSRLLLLLARRLLARRRRRVRVGVAMVMAVESERGSDERANSTQQGIDPVRTFNSHASPFRTGCHKALFAHASL